MVHASAPSLHATATMRANRGSDTAPEVALRRELHGRGLRFRKNFRLDLAPKRRVRPDIVFSRLRLAIFVDGCYWHSCPEHYEVPATNTKFWEEKFAGTRRRDKTHTEWLEEAGWRVMRFWEHEPIDQAAERVIAAVAGRRKTLITP